MKTAKSKTQAYRIRRYEHSHPGATAKEIAKALGVTEAYVYVVRSKERKSIKKEAAQAKKEATHGRAAWQTVAVMSSPEPLPKPTSNKGYTHVWVDPKKMGERAQAELSRQLGADDPVNHPAHYKVGGIETIDFIEAKGLNYNTGNAVKYITRADYKGNRKQDLEKAVWYLNREISRIGA
jgi:hypothetical protein